MREGSAHVQDTKKTQPRMVGVNARALLPLPLERTVQQKVKQVSWLAALPYALPLPKAVASVVFAEFDPLTVTG
jgi:hypothetical protein